MRSNVNFIRDTIFGSYSERNNDDLQLISVTRPAEARVSLTNVRRANEFNYRLSADVTSLNYLTETNRTATVAIVQRYTSHD